MLNHINYGLLGTWESKVSSHEHYEYKKKKYARNLVRTRRERDIQWQNTINNSKSRSKPAGLKQNNHDWKFNGELIRNIINSKYCYEKDRKEK